MLHSARWGRHPRACAPVGAAHRCNRLVACLGALAAGVVALLATAPDAEAATCRGRNFVDSLSIFATGTARATSSNGETYDRIESGTFDADFRINLCGDGAIDAVIVHLGQCSGHERGGCTDDPIMYQELPRARDLSAKRTFSFAIPPDSGAGRSILQTCNAHADEQKGAGQDKEIFPGFFGVTLGVDTRRDPAGLSPPAGHVPGAVAPSRHEPLAEYSKTATGQLTLKILCAPLPAKVEEIKQVKIAEAALGVATSGNSCPKPATATVAIAAEAPRPVLYKIERGNGTTTTVDWIEGRIKLQKGLMGAKSAFLHAQHDLGALDPGTRKFRLWIDGWGKTPWQAVEVADCLEALSGKLTLRSLGATACRGEALVAIHTDGAGTLPYELECGPGRSWQRSVTAPANKIGVDKVQFDVANNERVTCVLRTRIAGKLKPLDGASMTFQCHRPSGASAADDLVPETRPDPKGPRLPLIVVDPPRPPKGPFGPVIVDPPRLSCAGGVVMAGRCHCPRTHKAVHAGKNAWRCVRSAVFDPPRKMQIDGARSQKAKAAAKAARKALRQRKGRRPVP
jgi:hypothetical protein